MFELQRTVRFSLSRTGRPNAAQANDSGPLSGAADNGFSSFPAMRGLGRYYELTVTCRGEADAATGYFLNIKEIDIAVRECVLPFFQELIEGSTPESALPMGWVMQQAMDRVQPALGGVVAAVELALSPMVRIAIESHDMNRITLRQHYEFSAAHRLHVDELSNAENRAVFGKCNNPGGHGHNYRLEVAVEKAITPDGHAPAVEALDRLVDKHVIDRLDHKHLNLDVPEFAELNPSVEHIAQVTWGMLEEPVSRYDTEGSARLVEVRVWETGKTACIYRGPAERVEAHQP